VFECSVQLANRDISQFHSCIREWRCEKEGMWNWTGIGRRDETVMRVNGLVSVGETRQSRG